MEGLCHASGLLECSLLCIEHTLEERERTLVLPTSFPFSTARTAVCDLGSTFFFLPCLVGNISSSGMRLSSHATLRTDSCLATSDICVYCSWSLSLYSMMRSWLSLSSLAHSVFLFSSYSFCLSSIQPLVDDLGFLPLLLAV